MLCSDVLAITSDSLLHRSCFLRTLPSIMHGNTGFIKQEAATSLPPICAAVITLHRSYDRASEEEDRFSIEEDGTGNYNS
jgi:hypothetical protein